MPMYRWPKAENTIAVSFENGGYRQEQKIRWSETNLLKDNPGTLRIRKGDSLRLTGSSGRSIGRRLADHRRSGGGERNGRNRGGAEV